MIRDMWEDGWFGRLLLFGIPSLIILMIVGSIQDAQQWAQFKTEHACKIVGQMRGDISIAPIVGGNGGVAISQSSDKTGWLCDDGVTYWR